MTIESQKFEQMQTPMSEPKEEKLKPEPKIEEDIDSKIEKLSPNEKRFFESQVRTSDTIDEILFHARKEIINKKTRHKLLSSADGLNKEVINAYYEILGKDRAINIMNLVTDFMSKRYENEILKSKSFDEVIKIINHRGGIEGSQEYFNNDKLIDIINRVRKGELTTDHITETYGLREKVIELLEKKEINLERQKKIEQEIKIGLLENFPNKALSTDKFTEEDIPLIIDILQKEKEELEREKWQRLKEEDKKELEELRHKIKQKGFSFRELGSGRRYWENIFRRKKRQIEYNIKNIPLKIEAGFNMGDIVKVPEDLKTDTKEGKWRIIGYDWERKIIEVKRSELPSLGLKMPPLSPKYEKINLDEFKKVNLIKEKETNKE